MLRSNSGDLVVRQKMPAPVRLALIAAAVFTVAAVSYLGYHGGRAMIMGQLEDSLVEIANLKQELASVKSERRHLQAELEQSRTDMDQIRNSLVTAEQQLQIDEAAYEELRAMMDASSRQIADLASELQFYRSIVSPPEGETGVRIQVFEIDGSEEATDFRFKLVLIQTLERETEVEGSVKLEVRGSQGGESSTLTVPETDEGFPARFKYFQNLAGTFSIPADFTPAEVAVIFTYSTSEDSATLKNLFPWPDLEP